MQNTSLPSLDSRGQPRHIRVQVASSQAAQRPRSPSSGEMDHLIAQALAGEDIWNSSGAQERLQRECMALRHELAEINQVCRVLRANLTSREQEIGRLQQLILEISRQSGAYIASIASHLGAAAGCRRRAAEPAAAGAPQRDVPEAAPEA